MCQAVKCSTCGRPDWRGCGAHVEQVLGHVPKSERCKCREQGKADSQGSSNPLKRLFGL